jgi:hypothetical protein
MRPVTSDGHSSTTDGELDRSRVFLETFGGGVVIDGGLSVVVVVVRGSGETRSAKTAQKGGTPPIVGLSFLVPRHAVPGGIDGELVIAVAAPVNGDAIAIDRPVRVRGVLLAHKVVEAVCMELNLPPAPVWCVVMPHMQSHVRKIEICIRDYKPRKILGQIQNSKHCLRSAAAPPPLKKDGRTRPYANLQGCPTSLLPIIEKPNP